MTFLENFLPQLLGGAMLAATVEGLYLWRRKVDDRTRITRLRTAVRIEVDTIRDSANASTSENVLPASLSTAGVRLLLAGQAEIVDLATFAPIIRDLERSLQSFNAVVTRLVAYSTPPGTAMTQAAERRTEFRMQLTQEAEEVSEICGRIVSLLSRPALNR